MRIGMVVSVLDRLGGIEAGLVTLGRELRTRGNEVFLYVLEPPARPNQNVEALERAGVVVSSPPVWSVRLATWGAGQRDRVAYWLSRVLVVPGLPVIGLSAVLRREPVGPAVSSKRRALQQRLEHGLGFNGRHVRLVWRLRRLRPDLVHVHGWGCGEDPRGVVGRLAREVFPLVYTEHNSPDPRLHPPIVQAPMNGADVLIAVSQAGRAGLETVGRARRPIRVIPYAVDPLPARARPAGSDSDGLVVTCLARLAPQKRHADLLEATALARRTVPNVRLVLAGTGPLAGELSDLAERLGLRGHVEFLGLVTRADLPDLLARTDVVALASEWEGLPVALIEALSAGKPIVASDAGGNPELVHDGVNGLVVPVGDREALARALVRLASDPAERMRMAAASAERYRLGGFDPPTVAEQHLAAYRLAIELRGQDASARLAA